MTDKKIQQLIDLLKMFNWKNPMSPYLLVGWCVIAPHSKHINVFPHICIIGSNGSGKTWIFQNVIKKLLGKKILSVQGLATVAGIRRALIGTSIPVLFDELEGNAQNIVFGLTSEFQNSFALSSNVIEADMTLCSHMHFLELIKNDSTDCFRKIKEQTDELFTDDFCSEFQKHTNSKIKIISENIEVFSVPMKLFPEKYRTETAALMAAACTLLYNRVVTKDEAFVFISKNYK